MKTDINIVPRDKWKTGGRQLLIAGPCSAETEEQVFQTALRLQRTGRAFWFRAGLWKPRTRPDAFEGVGAKALPWLTRVNRETGLTIITEVASAKHVEACLQTGIRHFWIGARSTVNPFTVQEIADALKGTDTTVLIKNPIHADLQLWLGALERVNKAGITHLGAIHRGFHVHGNHPFRNHPLWEIVVELKRLHPNLPVLCDPSHIAGQRELIPYLAQKAIDMDLDGWMIEAHVQPDLAWSDARQQVTPEMLNEILEGMVERKKDAPLNGSKEKLEQLRDKINALDEELLQAFRSRMQLSEQIGELKKSKNMTILQLSRWDEMLEQRIANGRMLGLKDEFIKRLFELVHDESIRIQTEILNPVLQEEKK
ncbi:MAG: bifunctional 3-deoxy-7-phosphoheptulonate synthase/chorismate mutase type II [Bacteroidia bacterium]|nr:bifunctional 3-deoxy-7-phosphoheptulonate synthase/chorismate mutase type II [Bacteroidia bacterium]